MGGGLIGGLFGRAAGAVLGGAMQQLQNQQEEVRPQHLVLPFDDINGHHDARPSWNCPLHVLLLVMHDRCAACEAVS